MRSSLSIEPLFGALCIGKHPFSKRPERRRELYRQTPAQQTSGAPACPERHSPQYTRTRIVHGGECLDSARECITGTIRVRVNAARREVRLPVIMVSLRSEVGLGQGVAKRDFSPRFRDSSSPHLKRKPDATPPTEPRRRAIHAKASIMYPADPASPRSSIPPA